MRGFSPAFGPSDEANSLILAAATLEDSRLFVLDKPEACLRRQAGVFLDKYS